MAPHTPFAPRLCVQQFAAAARMNIADLHLSLVSQEERYRMFAHLLRLSDDDRRMRFMKGMSDRELEAFVQTADFSRATRLGWFDPAGELVALCEGFSYFVGSRPHMEVAFSTDAAWRRLGLAKSLFTEMACHAQAVGVECLELHCDSRNAGMRSLLRSVDAQTCLEAGEVDATWAVPS